MWAARWAARWVRPGPGMRPGRWWGRPGRSLGTRPGGTGRWSSGRGLVVGGIGFFGPPLDAEVEIGYGIVPSRQGRGYATEAVLAMIAMAWADARVRTVVAGTDPGNVASQRVLGKAGFRRIAGRGSHWPQGEFRYELIRPARG